MQTQNLEYKCINTKDFNRSNHYAVDSLLANEIGDDTLLLYGHDCCKSIGKNILVAYNDDSALLSDNPLMTHLCSEGFAGVCVICKVRSGVDDIELISNSKFRSLTKKDIEEINRLYEDFKAIAV